MLEDINEGIMLELTKTIEMETRYNRDDFSVAHTVFTVAMLLAARNFQSIFLKLCFIFFAKVVTSTKDLSNFGLVNHRTN